MSRNVSAYRPKNGVSNVSAHSTKIRSLLKFYLLGIIYFYASNRFRYRRALALQPGSFCLNFGDAWSTMILVVSVSLPNFQEWE